MQPPRYPHKQIKVTWSRDEIIILQRHSWVGNHTRSYQQLAVELKGLFAGLGQEGLSPAQAWLIFSAVS